MTVKPARDAFLECDGCHKEIKPGASTFSGLLMTFRNIEDGVPLFKGPNADRRYFHVWCLDPKAVEPEGYDEGDA